MKQTCITVCVSDSIKTGKNYSVLIRNWSWGIDPVATLGGDFKALTESKDQKTLKIATFACLSLVALSQTEMLVIMATTTIINQSLQSRLKLNTQKNCHLALWQTRYRSPSVWADFAPCSHLGQCNLIWPSPTPCSTAVAIICRLSHIPCLSAGDTGTLRSTIRIALPHPSRAAANCHNAGIPDGVADTRCCHCFVPAPHPAHAMTMITTRKTAEEWQRQPRKVLHMPYAISDVLNIGWAHSTVGPPLETLGGLGPPVPSWLTL